jgi:hypothetical protein
MENYLKRASLRGVVFFLSHVPIMLSTHPPSDQEVLILIYRSKLDSVRRASSRDTTHIIELRSNSLISFSCYTTAFKLAIENPMPMRLWLVSSSHRTPPSKEDEKEKIAKKLELDKAPLRRPLPGLCAQ